MPLALSVGAMTKYRTILADPPWSHPNLVGTAGGNRHYDLMSLADIKSLTVGELADEDAHLWLWTANTNIGDGLEVIRSWGFTYRSCLTWIKPYFRLGHYLRNQTEHLLLATRGTAPIQFKSQGTWFYAPVQEHSHKPEEQYAIIERCSSGPYLELFARRRQPRWHVWGNEVSSDIEL